MGKIITESWIFDDNDKKQIKQYSKQIALKFKITNFNPKSLYNFLETFSLKDFDFIPCIREGLSFENFNDYNTDIAWTIIESAKTAENASYSFSDMASFLEIQQ